MVDAMGLLRTTIAIASLATPEHRLDLTSVLVDTGSEYNWLPAMLLHSVGVAPVRVDQFEMADGRVLEREVGFAMIYVGPRSTASVVVFAHATDMVLLGAIALEGLNLRVDLAQRALVGAGPVPAAGVAA